MPPASTKGKVGLISLGCPKNLVDSEVMLGILRKDGYVITANENEADVLIVNTCAFISDSEKESMETIQGAAKLKKRGNLKKLIVTGCLAQRYPEDLGKRLPGVDHFIGTGEFPRIAEFVGTALPVVKSAVEIPEYVYDYATPRLQVLPKHTAYVKVAEGCSRTCSFCIIPTLRGKGRSRPIESVVKEAENLVAAGAVELNLIAQDLTAYGLDLKDRTNLEKLLRELDRVEGLRWIRLLYNYPMFFTDSLVDLIASSEKICNYLDIPLQHADSELLATMRRYVNEQEIRALIAKLRDRIPGITLRTTLIVGFPGETEKQFEKLVRFVEESEFDRLGVFTYSRERGTPAAELPGQVLEKVKRARKDKIMRIQQKISKRRNEAFLGREMNVLVDSALPPGEEFTHVGRTEGQAMDIDGCTYLKAKDIAVGSIVRAKITGASDYDLFG